MKKPALDATTAAAVEECSPNQLQKLLALALGPPPADGGDASDAAGSTLIAELGRTLDELGRGQVPGAVLFALAISDGATLAQLRTLKAAARRYVDRAGPGPAREAAKLLYHLSIARAFVAHGTEISRTPIASRQALYRNFAESLAQHPIGRIFADAISR